MSSRENAFNNESVLSSFKYEAKKSITLDLSTLSGVKFLISLLNGLPL